MLNPQYSFRDAAGVQLKVKDPAYLVRYDKDLNLHLLSCIVARIVPQNGQVELVAAGPEGPETISTSALEIYANPATLLEKTLRNLEILTERTPGNIMRMKEALAAAAAGTIQKVDTQDHSEEI